MPGARSRILLSVPAKWDVARLHSALAGHPDTEVVSLRDAAAVLDELNTAPVDVVILAWPLLGMDPGEFFAAVAKLPRRPELLTIDAPDAPRPPPDAGIHASLALLP